MKWDITTEEIKKLHKEEQAFFDPSLSYEITSYRPINQTQGLDFDPKPFTAVGRKYDETKKFSGFPMGSKSHKDWWEAQIKLCCEGMTYNGYRITGDHYFFLNFYTMTQSDKNTKAGGGREKMRPKFWAAHYEYFHYIELCEVLGYDAVILKSRGVGASEVAASLGVRPFITTHNYSSLYVAYAENFLSSAKGILSKCWAQLNWLNLNSEMGMRRVRMVQDDNFTKKASKRDAKGTEYGRMAIISGQVVDKTSKLRGDRVDRLFFEECFGKGTKIRMSDLSLKEIQDVEVGDFVLGLDGEPKEVINTSFGTDQLYKINQKKGVSYITNSKHKLVLEQRARVGSIPDKIIEISSEDFFNMKKGYYKRTTYGIKNKAIEFNNTIDIDPYWLGLWLGDGNSNGPEIVINETDDIEIKEYIEAFAKKCKSRIYRWRNSCKTKKELFNYRLNRSGKEDNLITKELRNLNLINNKHIPKEAFFTPLEDRLKILAGIIDTDGNIKKGSSSYSFCYEIAMSRESLINDISLLARTCGFDTKVTKRILTTGYKKGVMSYRVMIKGDVKKIPVLVERKKIPDDYKKTSNSLSSSISIEKINIGDYYGITLKSYNKDNDNLFLLEDFTVVHNCGSNKILRDTWVVSEALVIINGKRHGIRVAFGTGGDEGPDLEGLEAMFLDPQTFSVLPYRHSFNSKKEPMLTGYFIPAWVTVMHAMDSRGVADEAEAKKYYEKEREKKKKDFKAYSKYCSEYCFYPEEALSRQGSNNFDQEKLADQYTEIVFHRTTPKVRHGYTKWIYESGTNNITGVKFIESPGGTIHIVEDPIKDEKGNHIKDLYVAGIDSIDKGVNDSMTKKEDASKFCITIKKRTFGMEGDKYVAYYMDRPGDVREAYEKAAQLLTMYNCKANLEDTKISIIGHFRERKWTHLLMKRPSYAIQGDSRKPPNAIGTQGTDKMIQHGLDLLEDYVKDYCHNIHFLEMIEQLQNYSWEKKGKYDLISSMIMCEIGDEELMGIAPKVERTEEEWQDIGYYMDEYGRRRYGIIPKNNLMNQVINTAINGYNSF